MKIWQPNEAELATQAERLAVTCYDLAQAGYRDGSPWSVATFASNLQAAQQHYLFLKQDDTLCGFLSYSQVLDEIEITNIVVAPAWQQQGWAWFLWQHWLAELADAQLFLEVRASNTPAYRLYEKLGFVAIGRRKAYYQAPVEDAILMKKEWKVQ
jgi:ribosomal-protein-alanine N-acetyltransferase